MLDKTWPNVLLKKLLWSKGSCDEFYWMESPSTLWIVAELFQVGVSTFLPTLNVTCFPLTKPPINDHPTHINLVWVNENHFALLRTKKNSLVPPLMYKWYEFRNDVASNWEILYKRRLEAGGKLFKKDIVEEVVILD